MNAICIGCGCDEQHACDVDIALKVGGQGCWWLRFDAAAGVGVCSACEDLMPAWDSSRRREPILPLIAERFYRQVMFLYPDKADAVLWMGSPQKLFAGATPRELVLDGQIEKLQAMLDQIRDGAYI